jgi:hypothetical protein
MNRCQERGPLSPRELRSRISRTKLSALRYRAIPAFLVHRPNARPILEVEAFHERTLLQVTDPHSGRAVSPKDDSPGQSASDALD